jgi:hypothetical protein
MKIEFEVCYLRIIEMVLMEVINRCRLTQRKPEISFMNKLIGDDIFIFIYLLTVIGLTPGGSNTEHIYTQTVHRTTQ